MRAGTAGHRTAGVNHLPVERHNAETVAVFFRHGDCGVHIFRDNGARKLGTNNFGILLVRPDKVRGDADKTVLVVKPGFAQFAGTDCGNRQERRAAGAVFFQEGNRAFRIVFVVGDDILNRCAEGGFNRDGVFRFHGDKLRKRAVNAFERAAPGFTHDRFDRTLIALHILFQVGKQANAVLLAVEFAGFRLNIFANGLGFFRAAFKAHRIAVHRVLRAFDFLQAFVERRLRRVQIRFEF